MTYTAAEITAATRHFDWDTLYESPNGTGFPIVLNGEVTSLTVVHTSDHEDSDYDNDIEVVVLVGEQFFRMSGYANSGSHCYGEYGNSWNQLVEVKATPKTITVYETL